jgi:hypothetical protein
LKYKNGGGEKEKKEKKIMGTPITQNYMVPGGDKWVIGAEGELEILGVVTGGNYVKRYFVDNVNGDDANAGLTWATAFEQIDAAITAWETFRALQTNVYAQGAIYVRGTGTAYDALAALPSYCDIIGVGAEPAGDGTGIVVIGANGADGIAGTARGLGLYNLQFVTGGAFWAADFVNLFRSKIVHCAFKNVTAAADGGLRFSGASGGLVIEDCIWMAANDVCFKVGIQAQGTHLNACRIRKNYITGTTAGVLIDATVTHGDWTVFEDNVIGDLGHGCVKAIDDNQPSDAVSWLNYVKNSVMGTNLITIANNGAARCHGNVSANDFVAVTAS